jgi:hypothetical protein
MILKLHLVKKFILINHVNYLFNMDRLYILKLRVNVICIGLYQYNYLLPKLLFTNLKKIDVTTIFQLKPKSIMKAGICYTLVLSRSFDEDF